MQYINVLKNFNSKYLQMLKLASNYGKVQSGCGNEWGREKRAQGSKRDKGRGKSGLGEGREEES